YNNESDIKICLDSLMSQTYKDNKIIVVDNNSADKTKEIVKSYEDVELIANKKNLFLTKANNKGIKRAVDMYGAEFVFVLNPDTKCSADLLETLLEKIEQDERIGA